MSQHKTVAVLSAMTTAGALLALGALATPGAAGACGIDCTSGDVELDLMGIELIEGDPAAVPPDLAHDGAMVLDCVTGQPSRLELADGTSVAVVGGE